MVGAAYERVYYNSMHGRRPMDRGILESFNLIWMDGRLDRRRARTYTGPQSELLLLLVARTKTHERSMNCKQRFLRACAQLQ